VDYRGYVTEFTYLGEDNVEARNLSLLPGIHEAMLSSAVHSHNKGFVADWIDHFRGGWATALYLDRFPKLCKTLVDHLTVDKGMLMILSRVLEHAETHLNDHEVSSFRRTFIGVHGENIPAGTKKTIETETIDFLKNNRTLLSDYHIPEHTNSATSKYK
jgi:hypothetical protein